ncbi:MAG: radical SAM protein [Thermoanaerobacteraceae bacterium]|nr:radical SAM protein [Thermoanaerobacteraceae bacterium]
MKCLYCEHRCNISEGQVGICGMYTQYKGDIVEKFPHCYSTYAAVHIESIPFFHAYPGSCSLLIGGIGCNLDCHYCINSYIAKSDPNDVFVFRLEPEKIIDIAKKTGCHNIVFGVNEVTVSLPSAIEVGKLAKKEGIPMGCLTNGYITEEVVEIFKGTFQFINVSLKSFSSGFYKRYVGIDDLSPILRNIRELSKKCHIEITTPIVSGINDKEIPLIAEFISSINPETPWHVFRLLPEYKMQNLQYPNIYEVSNALQEARKVLPYIYFSNFAGSDWVSTFCPECGGKIIKRIALGGCGAKLTEYALNNGKCPVCGKTIPLYGEYIKWNSREEG